MKLELHTKFNVQDKAYCLIGDLKEGYQLVEVVITEVSVNKILSNLKDSEWVIKYKVKFLKNKKTESLEFQEKELFESEEAVFKALSENISKYEN